jgi:hypothetical protein
MKATSYLKQCLTRRTCPDLLVLLDVLCVTVVGSCRTKMARWALPFRGLSKSIHGDNCRAAVKCSSWLKAGCTLH